MEAALEQRPISTPVPVRLRGERLYWLLQTGGWGFVFVLELVKWAAAYTNLGPRVPAKAHPAYFLVCECLIPLGGLLLSHLGRCWIHRRGWQRLSLRALAPRIVLLSLVQGVAEVSLYFAVYERFFPPAQYRLTREALHLLGAFSAAEDFLVWWGLYFVFQLFGRLAESERDSLQLAARIKEAELLSLKAQVNPHFIFNALNSLRLLIGEDTDRARQAVSELAGLLRYGLRSGSLETVPLADELRATRDYLALEQLRYEERLRLRIEVAPEALPLPIPPMLLQTLAENAVKYGVAAFPQGGEVAIAAWVDAGGLRLEVANGCPGGGETESAVSTGIGLRNAAERIRLLFGPQAYLRLRNDGAERVIAEAALPARVPAPALR